MARKGNQRGYVSQGLRSNVSRNTRSIVRREKSTSDKFLDKIAAYWRGTNPWIAIENPNKLETNKKFIRVRANDLYGNPRDRKKAAYVMKR